MGGMRSLIVFTLVLVAAAPARAGTYEVHTLSAASPGLDGWSPYVHAPRGYVAVPAGPGGLAVQFHTRGLFDRGDVGEWVFTAPPDTTIVGWDVERAVSGIGAGGWNTLFAATGDGRVRFLYTDVPSQNRSWAVMHAGALAAGHVTAMLRCAGPGPCRPAPIATLRLRNSRVLLHDAFAPVASAPQGDLAGEGPLAGTAALSFTATDRGAGLYRAYAVVDGRRLEPVEIGEARCHALLAGGGAYAFGYRRPCPLGGGAVVAVDTTSLLDGRHTIAVVVEDAAGNAVTVYGPATRLVDNVPDPRPPAPRPRPRPALPAPRLAVTAWLERGRRRAAAMTVRYGERVRIRGRVVVLAGGPASAAGGAALDVAERVALPRAAWRPLTGLRALADGRFTTFARVGPSRRLRIVAPGGDSVSLTLRVRAPVTAQLVRGSVLRGRLRGGYVPRGGAFVELQARADGRWVTRRVVRTFSSGRYRGRPGARGPFRARVPRQSGLPFAAGVSPPRTAGRTTPRTSR